MASASARGRLLYGSDRPVVEPLATGSDTVLRENGAWLSHGAGGGMNGVERRGTA